MATFTTTTSLGLDGYWVSPKGEIINVMFCRHAQTAQEICSAMGINDVTPEQAEVKLNKMGWLHIGLNYVGKKSYNDITDNQVDALYKIYRQCTKALYAVISDYMIGA